MSDVDLSPDAWRVTASHEAVLVAIYSGGILLGALKLPPAMASKLAHEIEYAAILAAARLERSQR